MKPVRRYQGTQRFTPIVSVVAALLVGLLPTLTIAETAVTTPAPSSTPAPTLPDSVDWVAYYSAVCGDVDHMVNMTKEQLDKLKLDEPVVQRVTYCTQAKMSQRTYHYSVINASINSAAFAVCTASCLNGLSAGVWTFGIGKLALDRACTVAGIAANGATLGLTIAAQIAAAKDVGDWFGNNIQTLVSVGTTAKTSITTLSKGATDASSMTALDKFEACLGAGMFGVQAGVAIAGSVKARGPWGEALYQANEQRSLQKSGIQANESWLASSPSRPNENTPPNDTPERRHASRDSSGDACASAVQTRNIVASTDCARSVGTTFPEGIYSKEFQDVFKQVAKQDLTTFLKSGADGMSALESSIGTQAASAIRAKQNQSVQLALANGSAAQYASSGGARLGGRGSSKSSDPFADIAGLMKGILPGGKKPAEEASSGGIQTYAGRGLASQSGDLSSDPRVSLFDRVSTAYRTQSSRTGIASQVDAWSLPINRASHGLK